MSEELMGTQELEADTQKDMYMVFESENEYFALSIKCVNTIVGYQSIAVIPESIDYIKGLINLRGKIIPVIDVRLRFKQSPIDYNDRTCIIVINVKSVVVGLVVEKIIGVTTMTKDDIAPPPTIGQRCSAEKKYVSGVGKIDGKVTMLLDPNKLISDSDLEIFDEMIKDQ